MDEKLVVCHFTPLLSLVDGGIERSVLQQRKALEEEDVEVVESPFHGFDVLHVNVFDPFSIMVFLASTVLGRKTVFTAHTTGKDFEESMKFSNYLAPVVGRFTGFFYSLADTVVAPSEYTRNLLKENGVDTDVEVVSNGLDTERLEKRSGGEEGFHVVNLGFVFERKGLSDFIEVARRMPEIDFHWFGPRMNGFMSQGSVDRKIRESPENVEFPGFIEDVNDAFELADVFFFPTKEENQGITMLEAAYQEVPIVVRDIPLYRDWFIDGKHCLKGNNAEEFVEQIEKIRSQEIGEELVENAAEIAENHTLDEVGESLRQVYTDLARN